MKTIFFNYSLVLLLLLLGITGCTQDESTFLQEETTANTNAKSGGGGCICSTDIIEDNSTIPYRFEPLVIVDGFTEDDIDDAIDIIYANNGGSLYFPPGVYNVKRIGSGRTALRFPSERSGGTETITGGLEIFGSNHSDKQTVFNLDTTGLGDEDPVKILWIGDNTSSTNGAIDSLFVHDFKINGNFTYDPITSDAIHGVKQHNIFIRNVTNAQVYNVVSTNARGDGINVGAIAPFMTSDVLIDDVCVNNINRSGIVFTGGSLTQDVDLLNSTFGPDIRKQQVDFEPEAGSLLKIFEIKDNVFCKLERSHTSADEQFAIATYTNSGDGIKNLIIRNNKISNGVSFTKGTRIVNFAFNGDESTGEGVSFLRITHDANDFFIANNYFNLEPHEYYGPTSIKYDTGIVVEETTLGLTTNAPNDITFFNNTIHVSDGILTGFYVEGPTCFRARDNDLKFAVDDPDNVGFKLKRNAALDFLELEACGNTFIDVDNPTGGEFDKNHYVRIPDTLTDAEIDIVDCATEPDLCS